VGATLRSEMQTDPAALRTLYNEARCRGNGDVDHGLVELCAEVLAAGHPDDLIGARSRIVYLHMVAVLTHCEELIEGEARHRAGTIAIQAALQAQELLDAEGERRTRVSELLSRDPGACSAPELLERAGLSGLCEKPEAAAVEAPLRALAELVKGADSLRRAVVRAAAVQALQSRGVSGPAALVDAALGTQRAEASDVLAGQGTALTLSDPEPWPEAVDGAGLLDAILAVLTRYVVLPAGAAVAAALWVLHTYLIGVLEISPLVTATSPQKRCNKSTLLDVLRALCRRALGVSNISAAAPFRVVEMLAPTLLIDEADTFFAEGEELRGILNAGHTRSTAQVVRTVGDDHEPRVFRTFCAKAIAAIGELPGTIEDRAISIHMKRRAPGEHVERLRRDRIDGELEPLRRRCARWARDNATAVRHADPDVPTTLNDRAADNWRPLLAIADAAGGNWPERARSAALKLSGAAVTEDSDVKVQLLADLRELFSERGNDKLASETIVEHLTKLEGRPWAEWRRGKPLTKNGLARLLKPFEVRPKQVWVSGSNVHGYERTDFADAWARYLPAREGDSEPLGTLEPAADKAETPFPQPLGDAGHSALKNAGNPCAAGILAGLADESG
jgi:putative DNA primase/helicase